VLVIESSFLEIAGAAKRNSAGVTEHFPLPLGRLYRERWTAAVDQLGVDKTAVDKIERQSLETDNFSHKSPKIRKPHLKHWRFWLIMPVGVRRPRRQDGLGNITSGPFSPKIAQPLKVLGTQMHFVILLSDH